MWLPRNIVEVNKKVSYHERLSLLSDHYTGFPSQSADRVCASPLYGLLQVQ